MRERIILDYAGFNPRPRWTHIPSGATCLAQPWMSLADWHDKKLVFFARFPCVPIETEKGQPIERTAVIGDG